MEAEESMEAEEGMQAEEDLEEEEGSAADATMGEEEEEAPAKQRAKPVYAATTNPVPRVFAARAKVAAEVRRLDALGDALLNVDTATAEFRHEKATMRKAAAAEASSKVAEAAVSRKAAHAGVKLSQKAAPKPVAPKPVAPKPVAKAAPNGQHLAGTPTNPPHGVSRVNPSQ